MAGCFVSYTWQQQGTSYPQVYCKFFKRIRKVQLQVGLMVLSPWSYMKYKLCILFSDAIQDRTWNIYFYVHHPQIKLEKVIRCALSAPWSPWILSYHSVSLWGWTLWVQPPFCGPSFTASVWGPRSFLNSGTFSDVSCVRGEINRAARHSIIDYVFPCMCWAPVK